MSSNTFVPLYFAAAWFMANRDLTDRLECPLGLLNRARVASVWRYWIGDAVFSAIALPVALFTSHQATSLFSIPHDGTQKLSLAVYPAAFVLIGLIWPKISAITIGSGAGATTLSIAALRDRFLGGPMIAAINADVRRLVDDYVERLAAAVRANPPVFAAWARHHFGVVWQDVNQPTAGEIDQLRPLLATAAAKDFDGLRQDASKLEMIPLRERAKPLMKVPLMTWTEEQFLYDAGIRSVRNLYFARRRPGRIESERWQVLRLNARRLFWTRCKLAAGAFIVIAGVSGATGFVPRLYIRPAPYTRGPAPSPQADRIDQLRDSPAYIQKGVTP
jgi:hypothetical protein